MTTKTAIKKPKRLFSVPMEYRKVIFQPNHITNSQYSYTLIQERIFNYIVFYLHTYVKKVMDGAVVQQLELFTAESNKDYIDINIPLNLIGKPNQYNEIRERAIEMISVQVKIELKNRAGQKIERVQGMITHVDLDKKTENSRTATLPIRMSKAVAMLILNVERENGTPINYTSFMFDVALMMQNKYAPRIYKLLSSWKKKGIYRCKLADLREFLQLGNKYKSYETIKRRILLPVQQELKDKADFWFELSETREGKTITGLNFIVKFNIENSDLSEYKL